MGRNIGLVYKPKISICISTTKHYAAQTVPLLVESLVNSGIKEKDIYVFEGGT
jgi:hypothetical protein